MHPAARAVVDANLGNPFPTGLSQTSMTAWIALNSTVRFLIEPCALLALMYWGIHTGDSMAEGIVIGALAPGAAIFVWWKLVAPKSASWLTENTAISTRNLPVSSVCRLLPSSPPARRSWPSHSQSSPSSTPAFSSSRPGADHIPSTRQAPEGPRPRHRPRLRARFLRWAHCRRPLRVVAAVTCWASLWLPIAAYHEALHAGSTEPAALTLRYPLLVRDAVDEPL